MNCTLPSTLRHRTFVRVASILLIPSETGCHPELHEMMRRPLDESVVEIGQKASELHLTESLLKQLRAYVDCLILQLKNWMITYYDFDERHSISGTSSACVCKLLHSIRWTIHGTIDKTRTSLVLVRDSSLNSLDRFGLACVYCLEEDIINLWSCLSHIKQFEDRRLFVKDDDSTVRKGYALLRRDLVSYWTHTMKGTFKKLEKKQGKHPWTLAFQRSASISGNTSSAAYFLTMLTSDEREQLLVEAAVKLLEVYCDLVYYFEMATYSSTTPEMLCFLMRNMTEIQRKVVFSSHAGKMLSCFINWPYRDSFVPIYYQLSEFMNNEDHAFVLDKIHERTPLDDDVGSGIESCSLRYQKLFTTFWKIIPEDAKRYMIDHWTSVPVLMRRDDLLVTTRNDTYFDLKNQQIGPVELLMLVSEDMTEVERNQYHLRSRVMSLITDRTKQWVERQEGSMDVVDISLVGIELNDQEICQFRKELLVILNSEEVEDLTRKKYMESFEGYIEHWKMRTDESGSYVTDLAMEVVISPH